MGLTISANKQQQATLVELSNMINTSKALAATLQHSLYSHAVYQYYGDLDKLTCTEAARHLYGHLL